MKTARYWHKEGAKIQCDLCPHKCVLGVGQKGLCQVRINDGGQLMSLVYGMPCGLAVDPIEKKPLNHFHPGSKVLSFGTVGCNLSCQFCQNWHMSKSLDTYGRTIEASPSLIAEQSLKHDCTSVAFTYNEPTVFAEFAIDVAKECHNSGVKTVAVTNGYIASQARHDLFAQIDAANVDLKAFTDDFYKKMCGGHLQPVLDTLTYLKNETNVWLEITNLIIPGENDSQKELNAMCDWIVINLGTDVPIHFSAFHPDFKLLKKKRTPFAILNTAREIAQSKKIKHVHLGNV